MAMRLHLCTRTCFLAIAVAAAIGHSASDGPNEPAPHWDTDGTPSIESAIDATIDSQFPDVAALSVVAQHQGASDSQSITIDASANIHHTDSAPLFRRQASLLSIGAVASSPVAHLASDDGVREIDHHSYHEDPSLTPEAIFANKKLSPDIAEFLGHLAQRSHINHKVVRRAPRGAGLAQTSSGQTTSGSGPEDTADRRDDRDDLEDMRRTAGSLTQTTALSHFFDKMDSKTEAASWLARDCAILAQNVSDKYAKMSGNTGPAWAALPSAIHTGMFFKHWGIGKEAARKLRLSVLSFLGTQDARKVKLHIWTDQVEELQDVLGPIAHHPELLDAINITVFDHKAEFAKVAPTLAREGLTELFKDRGANADMRADLFRSIILYNYGGLWMDADTMLMRDISPLLGEDWVHLGRGRGGLQGSLISASKPASPFTTAYLIGLVMRHTLGDEPEKPLLAEVFDKDPSRATVHALPPCFFDSDPLPEATDAAVLSSGASIGSPFFGKSVPAHYRAFFSMGIEDAAKVSSTGDVSVLQGPAHHVDSDNDKDEPSSVPAAPVWAYHWQGNFGAAWVRGSMADVAERTFMKRVGIQVPHRVRPVQSGSTSD